MHNVIEDGENLLKFYLRIWFAAGHCTAQLPFMTSGHTLLNKNVICIWFWSACQPISGILDWINLWWCSIIIQYVFLQKETRDDMNCMKLNVLYMKKIIFIWVSSYTWRKERTANTQQESFTPTIKKRTQFQSKYGKNPHIWYVSQLVIPVIQSLLINNEHWKTRHAISC